MLVLVAVAVYTPLAWVDRQIGKTHASLKAMSQGLGDKPFCAGIYLSLADISVGCALGYLDFRFGHEDWRPGHPALSAWFAAESKRESFVGTAPPAAWIVKVRK